MAVTVLLADDHPCVLAGAAGAIEAQPDLEVVDRATDGRRALESVRRHRPDVLVTDLAMPEMSGLALIGEVRKTDPAPRVIVYSIARSLRTAQEALECGVDGYLCKGVDLELLVEAIRSVARGEAYVGPCLRDRVTPPALDILPVPCDYLSRREKEVLTLLCRGLSTRQIAGTLFLSEHTVNRHRVRIMDKVGVRNVPDLFRRALISGLVPV